MYIDVHWNTKVVIDSMAIGVSVFDADGTLTVWNKKYLEIFEKPATEVYPGVPFRTLLQHEKDRGDFPGDIEAHISDLVAKLNRNQTVTKEFRTRSGKVISSTHAPMPGGGWVGTHLDISAQTRAVERIEHAALHDALTGLPNRMAFDTRIGEMFGADGTTDHGFILMLLDLDRFKEVNDTFGHPVGDEMLKGLTRRMRSCLRQSDMIARIGGDEFAIVLNSPRAEASRIAKGVAKALLQEAQRPYVLSGNRIAVGASIGICVLPPGRYDAANVIKTVDRALYRAKDNGRNRYEFCSDLAA